MRRLTVVAELGREVALGDPGGGPVAGRRKLFEACLGPVEHLRGLVEPILLEERASEDELGVTDLVDELDPAAEQLERMARLLLGEHGLIGP